MDLRNAIEECFPNNSKNMMSLISFRSGSDEGLETSKVRDIPQVLEEAGRNRKGMLRMQKLLGKDEQPLAMEYTGPYGDIPGYHSDVVWDWRPWANAIMLSDRNGTPTGMVPVGCRRMREWEPFKSLKGIVTNPIIIGILLGMVVSACRIPFPFIVQKTLGSMSSLATPLALLGLGAGFEGRKALKQLKPTTVASLIKLVIWPVLFLPLAVALGFTGEKLVAILIMLGSPTTVSCYIMARNMGHEGTLTSSVVVATTFFSSVTITLFLFLLRSMSYI